MREERGEGGSAAKYLGVPIAPHDQVAFDGLHQGQGVDLDGAALPLLQAGA